MSEIEKLLRFQGPAFNEFKVSQLEVSGEMGVAESARAVKFSSQLSTENSRIGLFAYNASATSSGELYYGDTQGVTSADGFPIPKGSLVEIPVSDDLDVYFTCVSGEVGNLRILELA